MASRRVQFDLAAELEAGLPTQRPETEEERAQRLAPPVYPLMTLEEMQDRALRSSPGSFSGLKPKTQKVLATTMACENLKGANYGQIKPDKIQTLLLDSSSETPNTEVGTIGQVVSYCSNPDKMFLRWTDQRYRLRLLNQWLSYHVKSNHPQFQVMPKEMVAVKKICVVPIPWKSSGLDADAIPPTETSEDGASYCRGFILDNPDKDGKVLIFYPDFGVRGHDHYQNLRRYEHELMSLPPFSFGCVVDNSQIVGNDSGSYKNVIRAAIVDFFHPRDSDSGGPRNVYCKIVKKLGKPVVQLSLEEPLRDGNAHTSDNRTLLRFIEAYLKANSAFRKDAIRNNLAPPGSLEEKNFKETRMEVQYYRKLMILSVSGQDIYGRIIHEAPHTMPDYEKWKKCLETDHKDKLKEDNRPHVRPEVEKPEIGRPYIWFDEQTKEWHRVIVLKCLAEPGMVTCWMVDDAEEKEVSVKNMKIIKPISLRMPAFAVKIHLSCIGVKNVVDFERELVQLCPPGTLVFGSVLEHTPLTASTTGFLTISHGMILIKDREKETLQTLLCKKGVAKPDGPPANWFVRKGLPAYYDTYHVKKLLAVKYPQVEVKEERYDIVFDPREKAEMEYGHKYRLPLRIQHCMSPVFICSPGIGPDGFYVQSLEHRLMLVHMEDVFKKLAPYLPRVPVHPFPLGYVVLASEGTYPEKNVNAHWGRVMIIEVSEPWEYVTVLYIDYGNIAKVPVGNLRELQQYFQDIPPMCQRVHLDLPIGKKPVDPNGWSTACVNAWKNFVQFWLPCASTYYAWTSKKEHTVVRLQEFQQPLAFDVTKGDWIPGRIAKTPEFKEFNCLRKDLYYREEIIEPFFTSIGINLSYYLVASKRDKIGFPSVIDFCERHGWLTETPVQPEE